MSREIPDTIRSSRYPLAAFLFVQAGLDWTVRQLYGERERDTLDSEQASEDRPARHISGQQLCHGLRDYAVEQYGLLARTVLARWGIHRCEDFGRIVFAMVEAGLLTKTDEDRIEDFRGVFDFADAFQREVHLTQP